MAKIMAEQLSQRLEKVGQKAALIVTSSVGGNVPCAGYVAYGASKAFETFVAEAMHFEFKETIDVMSYKPSNVESGINKRKANASNLDMITNDEAAESCLA